MARRRRPVATGIDVRAHLRARTLELVTAYSEIVAEAGGGCPWLVELDRLDTGRPVSVAAWQLPLTVRRDHVLSANDRVEVAADGSVRVTDRYRSER